MCKKYIHWRTGQKHSIDDGKYRVKVYEKVKLCTFESNREVAFSLTVSVDKNVMKMRIVDGNKPFVSAVHLKVEVD